MTLSRWQCLAFVLVLGMPSPSLAADAAPDSLGPRTLEQYLRLARTANPRLQAATQRAAAARERTGSAASLADPRLMYGYYVTPDEMKGRQEISLLQPLPFFGKRGLRREIASSDARVEAQSARVAALGVDFEVKRAFYQYVGATENARVLENEADLLRRMREVAQVRYASGKSEQQEVLKIDLSISRVADEKTINEREIAVARARLNELIGRVATTPLPDPEWVLPDLALIDSVALPESAQVRRPEITAAREGIARADALHRLAKREYWPDFMLGVNYEFGGNGDPMSPWMSEGWWELMAGIDVPVWIGKRRAMVREAEAMRRGAAYELEATGLATGREVEEAGARARAARDRYERFKNVILPQGEAAFASSEASYRSGRVDFIDYLDSERVLLELRRDYAMVIAELGTSMAELARAAGEYPAR